MRSWSDNISFPADQSLAAIWLRITPDYHPLVTDLPESKLSAVDQLARGESVPVPAAFADRLLANARKRRPGASYATHEKTLTLTVIERTA